MERCRDRTCRGSERALLSFAQETLHLQHVAIADPRDREQNQREQHNLRAQPWGQHARVQPPALQR